MYELKEFLKQDQSAEILERIKLKENKKPGVIPGSHRSVAATNSKIYFGIYFCW
jgi:hypothetical protein